MALFTFTRIDCADPRIWREAFLLRLAAFLLILGLIFIAALIWIPIPPSGQDTAKVATGFIFGTLFATLVNYFWGTSQGSKDKESLSHRVIESLSPRPNDPTDPTTQ